MKGNLSIFKNRHTKPKKQEIKLSREELLECEHEFLRLEIVYLKK